MQTNLPRTDHRLQALLLGPPEIVGPGGSIRVPRQATRALFYYLAAQRNPAPREDLIELFWPEAPRQQGQSRLRETLSRLKGSLGEPEALVVTPEHAWIDPAKVYVDQHHFEELAQQAGLPARQIPESAPLPMPVFNAVFAAVSLWRGARYLAGARQPDSLAYDQWWITTNERLTLLQVGLLKRLLQHTRAANDLEHANQFLHLAFLQDNLDQDLHAQLIQLMLDLGQFNQAQAYYHYVVSLLLRELGEPPGQGLLALQARVQAAEVTLVPEAHWHLRPSLETPFVGRAAALAELSRGLRAGGVVYLSGEAGLGKTRLLQRFVQEHKTQARLANEHCRPLESHLPLQPLISLLRQAVREAEWMQLAPPWFSQILLLLPELAELRPKIDRPIESQASHARAQLAEAIRQVFLLMAEKTRLLVILDDVQWVDEATLDVLAYLVERSPFDRGSLLVLSARQEEPNQHLATWLPRLRQTKHFRLVELQGLTPAETGQLCQAALGIPLGEPFLLQLQETTGGNAFYILEILRSLLDSSLEPDLFGELPLPIPASIHSLVQERLQGLSPEALEFLRAASLLGSDFEPRIVQAMIQVSGARAAAIQEELSRRNLIQTHRPETNGLFFAFVHDIIREAVVKSLSPTRNRVLSEAALQALEASPGPPPAAVLARFALQAGDLPKAFDYWVLAARNAWRLLSPESALQAFQKAEALIELLESQLTEQRIYQLYAEWSEMAFELDDPAMLQQLNERLLKFGRQRQSNLLIGAALDGLGDACMVRDRFEDGLAYSEQAIPYLVKSSDLFEMVQAHLHRGTFLYMTSRIKEAGEALRTALQLASAATSPQTLRARANAHYQMAVLETFSGSPVQGRLHALQSLEDAQASHWPYGAAAANSALTFCEIVMGNYAASHQVTQAGIEIAERVSAWRILAYLHAYRSQTELFSGNLYAAIEHARLSTEISVRHQHADISALSCRVLGDLCLGVRTFQDAVVCYRRGVELGGGSPIGLDCASRLGMALVMTGDSLNGAELIRSTHQTAQSAGLGWIEINTTVVLGLVHVIQRDWTAALSCAQRARAIAEEKHWLTFLSISLMITGLCAGQEGKPERMAQNLRAALEVAQQMPSAWIEAQIHQYFLGPFQKELSHKGISLSPQAHHLMAQMTNPQVVAQLKDLVSRHLP
jgi:DNA-binding SARP family transcriptional activator